MNVYPGEKVCDDLWYCGAIDLINTGIGSLPHTLVFTYKTEIGNQQIYIRLYKPFRKEISYGKRKIGNNLFEIIDIHPENYGIKILLIEDKE